MLPFFWCFVTIPNDKIRYHDESRHADPYMNKCIFIISKALKKRNPKNGELLRHY